MLATETLLAFSAMAFAIELTPGPNMAYLALIGVTEGRRAGYAAVAGVALGLAVMGLAAALGLTLLLETFPLAYQLLRWAGVGYLLWLAWEGWRGAVAGSEHAALGSALRTFFERGLITNLLNPKAAVFFVAILPEFLPPEGGAVPAVTLSAIYVLVATLVHAGVVALAGSLQHWLADADRNRLVRRLLALALVGVSVWLIWKI